jgi:Lon protease-like protein
MLYKERGEALTAEERDARLDTPIFVCQLSFPGMPTLLHFFEPRYAFLASHIAPTFTSFGLQDIA